MWTIVNYVCLSYNKNKVNLFIYLLFSRSPRIGPVLSDSEDEHGERDVPDVAASVLAAVRHQHDLLHQVSVQREAYTEHHRLPDVPHVRVLAEGTVRTGQTAVHSAPHPADTDAGEERRQ